MKIGNYEIYKVETGTFALDGGAMFGIVPKIFWNKTNPADELNRIALSARCLLALGNNKIILIDDGLGNKLSDKFKNIYKVDNTKYTLENSLKKIGISTNDVTDVILTHCHFDHCGGSTKFESEKIVPTFKNAIYHLQKDHWQLASTRENERDRASFIPIDFESINSSGQLSLVEGEVELFPQIKLFVCNGHTNSQQLPLISDGKNSILFCCDLIPTISHMPFPYIMGYDLRPLQTLEEKKKLLTLAEKNKWILFSEHDPNDDAVTLKSSEKGFVVEEVINF